MDENRCVINVSLQESRREIIGYLIGEEYTLDPSENRSRDEIIESFLPLYVDKTSKTYWMMGNITCAAAASSSGKMINMEKFYEWIGRHGGLK